MSSPALITHALSLTGDQSPQIGSLVPASVSFSSGLVYRLENITVADNFTAVTLWAANGGLATFSFGIIQSNADVLIEIKNSLGTAEYDLLFVPANVPVYFGGTTRGGTTQRITGGVQTVGLGNVIQIVCQRNVADAVGDASVSLMLFK